MCNLYSMTRAREAVLRLFKVSDNRAEQFDSPAIFPGYKAPVVRKADDGARDLTTLPNALTAGIDRLIRSFDANQMRIVQKGTENEDLLAA